MGCRNAERGPGRRGPPAAYDCAKYGTGDGLVLADVDLAQRIRSAARVTQLVGRGGALADRADVTKAEAMRKTIKDVDVLLSGVPYFLNEDLDGAIREWKKALEINPNHPQARKDLENAEALRRKLASVQ